MPRKTREKDALCEGCSAGVPHLLHYSSKGTPETLGMMVAGLRFRPDAGRPPIVIECAGDEGCCTWSAWWNDNAMSDAEFTRRATQMGWTIFPHPATRCPQHRVTPLTIEVDPLLTLLVGEEA